MYCCTHICLPFTVKARAARESLVETIDLIATRSSFLPQNVALTSCVIDKRPNSQTCETQRHNSALPNKVNPRISSSHLHELAPIPTSNQPIPPFSLASPSTLRLSEAPHHQVHSPSTTPPRAQSRAHPPPPLPMARPSPARERARSLLRLRLPAAALP